MREMNLCWLIEMNTTEPPDMRGSKHLNLQSRGTQMINSLHINAQLRRLLLKDSKHYNPQSRRSMLIESDQQSNLLRGLPSTNLKHMNPLSKVQPLKGLPLTKPNLRINPCLKFRTKPLKRTSRPVTCPLPSSSQTKTVKFNLEPTF